MKYYFYIAFYDDGTIRCFNTKREPKPINRKGDAKLIDVKKYTRKIK